jgi:hypothetical protein
MLRLALLSAATASEDLEAPVISLNIAQLRSSEVREAYKPRTECDTAADCNQANGEQCLRPRFKNGDIKGVDGKHGGFPTKPDGSPQMFCCNEANAFRDTTESTNNLNGGYYAEYCQMDDGTHARPKVSNSFADECEVTQNLGYNNVKQSCDEPSATAYDHHEGDISASITTVWKLFVKSDPGNLPVQQHTRYSNTEHDASLTGIDRAQRGEYVITYDVTDSAGNRAEQVQFALIMLDSIAPSLTEVKNTCEDGGAAWTSQPSCTCAVWKQEALVATDISTPDVCQHGNSVGGTFFGCSGHTTKTNDFCAQQNPDSNGEHDACGSLTCLTPGMSNCYEVGQGDYKCHDGQVLAEQLEAGKLKADVTTKFKGVSSVTAEDAYDGVVSYVVEDSHGDVVQDQSLKFSSDFSSCTAGQVITPPAGVAMTIKTEDFADIFGRDNKNNKHSETFTFAVQDTIPPNICQRSDGAPAQCEDEHIWRDFECGVSGIADTIDAKFPLYQKVNGAKSTETWKPPYADCRDFFYHEKSMAGAYTGAAGGMYAEATSCSLAKLKEKVGAKTGYESCMSQEPETPSAEPFTEPEEAKVCSTNQDCSENYSCLVADGDATGLCFRRVQTGSGFLQYTATDCSGNDACPHQEEFFVVDTIPPTLYLTSTEIDTQWNHAALCSGVVNISGTVVNRDSHWTGSGAQNGDWTGEFCTAYEQMLHRVTRQGDTNHTHAVVHPGSAYTNAVEIQHSAGYATDYNFIEDLVQAGIGFLCFDLCSGSETSTTTSWSTQACGGTDGVFDMLQAGTYYLTYECQDKAGHKTSACRTINNEDKTKPVITILEASNTNEGIWTTEASRESNYVDSGATCTDMVDGNISQDVEVSGDVVNMANPGTYRISYNCKDSAGQEADTAIRTVVVKDTLCPTCALGDANAQELTVEASFPYSEVPTTCTDTLDGALTPVQTVSLDSDPSALYKQVDVELTGTYTITYCAKDMHNNGDVSEVDGVQTCTCTGSCQDECKYRTVTVQDTIVPIIQLHYQDKDLVQAASGSGEQWSYMAERSRSNGWFVGAVASAVSGIALLGYTLTRKTVVATSVPV